MTVCNDCIPCYHCKETNNCNEVLAQLDLNAANIDLLSSMSALKPYMLSAMLQEMNCATRNAVQIACAKDSAIQADWNETDSESAAYIKNKPDVLTPENINAAIDNDTVKVNGDNKLYAPIGNNVPYAYVTGFSEAYNKGTSIIVHFNGTGDIQQRLWVRSYRGNTNKLLPFIGNDYYVEVPHNFSLVYENSEIKLVDTNIVDNYNQLLLLTNHSGRIIKRNLFLDVDNTKTLNDNLNLSNGFTPKKLNNLSIGQGATVVNNEFWFFNGGNADHSNFVNVTRYDKNFVELGQLTHNLGHVNGADFKNNTLVVYNGSAQPPEIDLYKIDSSSLPTKIDVNDNNNTKIIFKEGEKQLDGDGSACFGRDNKTVFYAFYKYGVMNVYQILLGLGDNDLSDKTTDKSDMSLWGTFLSNKNNDEYNGTAKIIKKYQQTLNGVLQPQDMCYNGDLFISVGFNNMQSLQFSFNDHSIKIKNNYLYVDSDYKDNQIKHEPEACFISDNQLFIGTSQNVVGVFDLK